MNNQNKETKEEAKKVKKLKRYIPHIVIGGITIVGGTLLGVKIKNNHSTSKIAVPEIVSNSREVVNYGKECVKELMGDPKELYYDKVDEDIYTKVAAAIETAVFNTDRDLPDTITLKRGYNMGDDWHKNVTIKIEDWWS